jgi:hypothetical protein
MAMRLDQFEQLTAYLDGELSAAERQEVEQLLDRDPEARQLLEELRQASRLVAALPRGKAPVDMSASVMARLERQALLGELEKNQPRRPRQSPGWGRLLGVAVGTLMMLTAGWLMVKQSRPAPGPPTQLALAEKRGAGTEKGAPGDTAFAPQSLPPRERSEAKETSVGKAVYDEYAPHRESVGKKAAPAKPASKADMKPKAVAPASPASEPASAGGPGEGQDLLAMAKQEVGMEKAGTPREAAPMLRQVQTAVTFADGESFKQEGGVADAPKAGGGYQLQSGPLSNRLELVVDADTRKQLVAEVEQFANSNGIPDLRSAQVASPIQPEQAFYYVESQKGEKGEARAGKDQPEEAVEVVMNVQAPQAAQLIESMEGVARKNRAQISWTANAVQVPDADAPAQVMRQLVTNSQAVLAERRAPVPGAIAQAPPEGERQHTQEVATPVGEGKVGQAFEPRGKAARGGGPISEPAVGGGRTKREAGAAGGAAGGQGAPAAEDYITLAISFRLSPSSFPENWPAKSSKGFIPAAAQATSAPAQTQPALRGDER